MRRKISVAKMFYMEWRRGDVVLAPWTALRTNNHQRIAAYCYILGLSSEDMIIWRKKK